MAHISIQYILAIIIEKSVLTKTEINKIGKDEHKTLKNEKGIQDNFPGIPAFSSFWILTQYVL